MKMNYLRIFKNSAYCSLISVPLGLLIGSILYWVFGIQLSAGVQGNEKWGRILVAVLVSPILETFIFVFVDIVTKRLSSPYRFVLGALLFSLLHILEGYEKTLFVFLPGLVFSYAYFYIGRTRSESFWIAALAHLIHNLALSVL